MIDFTIKPDAGDEYDITATSRDVLMWEKTTKGAVFSKLMEQLTMVDLFKVAYFACKRQGMFAGTQAEFEATHELAFKGETEAADPSQTAP